jgi:hypothetical protein
MAKSEYNCCLFIPNVPTQAKTDLVTICSKIDDSKISDLIRNEVDSIRNRYHEKLKEIMILSEADYAACSKKNNIEIELLKTVAIVEGCGRGFALDVNGNFQLRILYEGHVFFQALKESGVNPYPIATANPTLCFPKWTREFYSKTKLKGEDGKNEVNQKEHVRLSKAKAISKTATKSESCALKAASWGLFQQLGMYHTDAGFATVEEMVASYEQSELNQLEGFIRTCRTKKILSKLISKDWRGFALGYNGAGYEANKYHTKLEVEYNKLKNV